MRRVRMAQTRATYADFGVGLNVRVPEVNFPYWKLTSGMRCLRMAQTRAAYAEFGVGLNVRLPEVNFPVLN